MPNPSINGERLYEGPRGWGDSKAKAGGRSGWYQNWTATELKKRAKEPDLESYSRLNNGELGSELRNY